MGCVKKGVRAGWSSVAAVVGPRPVLLAYSKGMGGSLL